MGTKAYLDYLEKEMTIMGILSAVCVAAPAGALNLLLGTKDGAATYLWGSGKLFIVTGSTLCVLAALFFYKQRSRLAWYYGQVCLTEALDGNPLAPRELRKLLQEADAWDTWIPYSWGFTALMTGFLFYLLAMFVTYAAPRFWPSFSDPHYKATREVVWGSLVVVGATGTAILQRLVLTTQRFEEEPWASFWYDRIGRSKKKLPHCGVFTRLRPSGKSGVGVFAIRKIPKDTALFGSDDDELVPVRTYRIEELSAEFRKLYTDFCVKKGKIYYCPENFNRLTPAWYLNEPDPPFEANVRADSSLRFFASRDIEPNEELTVRYSTYSDNDSPRS